MYSLYDVIVVIEGRGGSGAVNPAPVMPDGLCAFIPDGGTEALMTADGAMFLCRSEVE